MITDESINIENDVLQKFEIDKLYDAMSKLKPPEQKLIHKLYLDKQLMTQAEYAKYLNIKETSVCQKVWKAKIKEAVK